MSIKLSDVKVGAKIETSMGRIYTIRQELDSEWVLYTVLRDGRKTWAATEKTSFVNARYTLITPFFEKGKVYTHKENLSGQGTNYTIEHVAEKGNVKGALAWYMNTAGRVIWTFFEESEFSYYKAVV